MVSVSEKHYYMRPCCDASLFNRGMPVRGTAKSSDDLDDLGYCGIFPIDWKFTDGYEAPMACYNYPNLLVKFNGDYQKLPVPEGHRFHDGISHYPFSEKHRIFVADTTVRLKRGWRYTVHLFRHDGIWMELACLTGKRAGTPLQFTNDGNGLLLLQRHKLLHVALPGCVVTTLYDAGTRNLSNAHITRCGRYVGVVTYQDNPESLEFILLGSGHTLGPFMTGKNPSESLENSVVLPLRVGDGMSEVTFVSG